MTGRGRAPSSDAPGAAHGFGTVGLPRIVANIDARNLQSIRIAEKIGMAAAGEGVLPGGRPCRAYVMTPDAARPLRPQKS